MAKSPPKPQPKSKPVKRLTQSALLQAVAEAIGEGSSRKEVKTVLDAFVAIAHTELKKNGIFVLPGFAKFIVVKKPARPARKGINPFTKEPTVFAAKPACKSVKARPQLARDDAKGFTWPMYATGIRARFKCDCVVLAVTPHRHVALWAAERIRIGGDSVFAPLVIGPEGTPVVTDPKTSPELAVLSVFAHGRGDVDAAVQIALAAGQAIGTVEDADRRTMYYDLIMEALSKAARKAFEMLPQGYQWQSEVARTAEAKGEAKGSKKAKGKAEDVLDILEARGLAVSDAHKTRVLSCSDLDLLRHWLRRAVTVRSTDELFAD